MDLLESNFLRYKNMSTQFPKLILPKPHLSWSQLSLWLSNPERYKKEYFDNADRLDTRYLRFGSGFAQLVEDLCTLMERISNRQMAIEELSKEYPMTENMKAVLMELEINGISEFEIRTKVMNIVPCFSKLDKYIEKENAIREYKTGLVPWNQAKVQKHDQLVFYATMLKWIGKPIPEYCDLDWIETKETQKEKVDFWRDGDKVLDVTGRIISFHREFDEREIERMEQLIVKVAWDISDAYQTHLSDI